MFRPFLQRSMRGLTAEFYLQPSRGGPRGRSPPCGNSRGAFRIDLHTHLQTLFDTSFTRIAKILEIIRHPKGLSLTSSCVGGVVLAAPPSFRISSANWVLSLPAQLILSKWNDGKLHSILSRKLSLEINVVGKLKSLSRDSIEDFRPPYLNILILIYWSHG